MPWIATSVAVLVLSAASAVAAYPARELAPEAMAADLAILKSALDETHPGLTRYVSRETIDAAFADLYTRAKAPMRDTEFYRHTARLLALLRCDHTKAEMPAPLATWRDANGSHLPFRFRLMGKRMWVFSSDPGQAPLPRGTEVLAINGVETARVIERLLPYMAIDGQTDPSRYAKLEADGDLMGSGFDQFYPFEFGFASSWRLRLQTPGVSSPQDVEMKPLTHTAWRTLPWMKAVDNDEFYRSVTWRIAGRNAMLRVDTLVNYRNPVDARAFYAAFFKQLAGSRVEHLVIDLRMNGGGSDEAAIELAAHLLEQPFTWTQPILQKSIRFGAWQQHVETWGDRKTLFEPPEDNFTKRADGWFEHRAIPKRHEPAPDRFKGRVSVLIGPRNASGATMLIAKLKSEGRVRLVGEATGGSAEGPTAGRMFFLKLPHSGIVARIPVYWNRMDVKEFVPGLGVAPDVLVTTTPADWLAERDTALDVALGRKAAAP
jgi:hypothetical protein